MNVYILGAGTSKCVGYPLGSELFDEIDRYVRGSGDVSDRFNYRNEWEKLHHWLQSNSDPTIVQAYQTRNIEHLFTMLDLATELRNEALMNAAFSRRTGARATDEAAFDAFEARIKDYQVYRSILLWALEHYFAWRHRQDYGQPEKNGWSVLGALADKIETGDAVITFNYDATIERVLLGRGKWSPRDGYGFDLVFQRSKFDKEVVEFDRSAVLVLHLHGATGWYHRPLFAPNYFPPVGGGGALPRSAFGPAPLETDISLDTQFLECLGISNVDACLPSNAPVADERHVVLHPSFLKDYENTDTGSRVLLKIWRRAAEALRLAEHVFIIGYSLPNADVAVLTLLLTTLQRGRVTVVNRSRTVMMRLGQLFGANAFAEALALEQWLAPAPQKRPQLRGAGP